MPSSLRGAHAGGARTAVLFHTFLAFWMRGIRARTRRDRRPPPRRRPGSRVGPSRRAAGRLRCRSSIRRRRSLAPSRHERMDRLGREQAGLPAAPDAEKRPLVLVSLEHNLVPRADRDLPAHHRRAGLAARARPGHARRAPSRPANCGFPERRLRDAVPHAEVLPRAAAVVGHGGHSTTMRALAHGVPVLVMPMHPLLDQPMVGAAVARAGAGLVLPRTAPSARIAVGRDVAPGRRGHPSGCVRGRRATAVDGCRLRRGRLHRTASRRAGRTRRLSDDAGRPTTAYCAASGGARGRPQGIRVDTLCR